MLAGNLPHGLEKAQLKGDGFLADQRRSLHHFLGSLKLAFGVHDLGAPFAALLRLV